MEVTNGKHFAAYMKSVRKRTLEVFRTVPTEREHWRLTEDSMSPVDILLHIGAVEAALWGAALKNGRAAELDEPARDSYDLAGAIEFLAEKRNRSQAFWRSLDSADLEREIITPTGHAHVLKRWLVLAAEHEIHHRSFVHAYRKLWGMQSHPIYGLTLAQLRENLSKLKSEFNPPQESTL